MVKTTITLEDELYRRLAKEAIERYGKTRSLSRLINEKLKAAEGGTNRTQANIEKIFGSWTAKQTGAVYVRKLRKESDKRLRRLGI